MAYLAGRTRAGCHQPRHRYTTPRRSATPPATSCRPWSRSRALSAKVLRATTSSEALRGTMSSTETAGTHHLLARRERHRYLVRTPGGILAAGTGRLRCRDLSLKPDGGCIRCDVGHACGRAGRRAARIAGSSNAPRVVRPGMWWPRARWTARGALCRIRRGTDHEMEDGP